MTNPLQTGADVVADAVDVAIRNEVERLTKAASEPLLTVTPTTAGLTMREQAIQNIKRRIVAWLERMP